MCLLLDRDEELDDLIRSEGIEDDGRNLEVRAGCFSASWCNASRRCLAVERAMPACSGSLTVPRSELSRIGVNSRSLVGHEENFPESRAAFRNPRIAGSTRRAR